MATFKKISEQAKGRYAEELPGVLWSYRTTIRTSTGETHLSLADGIEAVIPAKTGIPISRCEWTTEK